MPTKLSSYKFIVKQIKQLLNNANVTNEQKLQVIKNLIEEVES